MNNNPLLLLCLCTALCCASCSESTHFITDKNTRLQIENDFQFKKDFLPHGDLFSVFNQDLTPYEKEALTFLYAYMPVGDITDYSGDFYLKNIRSSLRTQQEMPWGQNIPEDIFRHFILPVRVNNENMDESRMVFYEELKDRVKNLSLYDAVLEVNHWCHEKVIYTPSDSRTSSPLASVRTAYGRCGEESVFTVAALRAVGIPARQVYTPRWAHTDDNHAWVEAWVDGQWYFLGACEPEPVLNMAWFNEPVARGMLMHTRVFGRYPGPEEIMETTDCFTEVNVTANYAPTAPLTVFVQNEDGNPLPDALVEFKVYNYANFYTVARKYTDNTGRISLSAGKGDMLVWVTHNGQAGCRKASFGKDNEVQITVGKEFPIQKALEMEIVPPVEGAIKVQVTDEQKAANAKRLAQEDSIRNSYTATFYTPEKAQLLAKELEVDPDELTRFMIGSRGNWKDIETFLRNTSPQQRSQAMLLLRSVTAKDLRDTPADILSDHLHTSYPHVRNELLTAYRSFFREALTEQQMDAFQKDPQQLINWVKENIQINDALNPQRIPIFPAGVWKARVADKHSRDIFFVSLAKSIDIEAQIDPVTGKVQYRQSTDWMDVDFESSIPPSGSKGKLIATYKGGKTLEDPKYYSHFTIAQILPDGRLHTLNFSSNKNDMGGGNTWRTILKNSVSLDTGNYLLITGTRMAKGNVLARILPFTIAEGKQTKIELVIRENREDIRVIGTIDAEAQFERVDTGKETSILATTGRGYFIIGILGARQEPTNHAMRDLAAVADKFNSWGRGIILLFPNEQDQQKFDTYEFGVLPGTITYGIDTNQRVTNMIANAMRLENKNSLPIFIIADTFGRVVFVSQGYTIGLGEQMMNIIGKI